MGPWDWMKEKVSDGAEDAKDAASPDWLDAEALGVGLTEDPVGFVQAVIMEWFVGGILSFAGAIAVLLLEIWGLLAGVIVDAGTALLAPFGAIGGVPISVLEIINSQIVSVSAVAGPVAPIVVVILWSGVVFMLAIVTRAILHIAPLVIPWL